MKIITTAFYVRPGEVGEKGWYWIAGMFSWLDTPTYTMTDAMSLFVSDSSWSQNDEDYISRMTYNRMVQHQDITKITEDRVLNEEGLYYTWDLPDEHSAAGIPLGKVEDLTFYVRGKTRVSDFTNPRSFTVYTQYEHVYSAINIQPEFSWDILKHGVSAVIGIDFVNNKNSYSSFCGVDYDPDRNIKN